MYWKAENAQHFSDQINTKETHAKLSHATFLIDIDLNKALDMFNAILKQQADCMKNRYNVNQNRKNEWFDRECKEARTNVRKLLKKFRKTSESCVRKKLHDALLNELVNYVKSQQYITFLTKEHNLKIIFLLLNGFNTSKMY